MTEKGSIYAITEELLGENVNKLVIESSNICISGGNLLLSNDIIVEGDSNFVGDLECQKVNIEGKLYCQDLVTLHDELRCEGEVNMEAVLICHYDLVCNSTIHGNIESNGNSIFQNIEICGGTIDNATIGSILPATGTFDHLNVGGELNATGDVYFSSNTIEFDDCNIDLVNNTIINVGGDLNATGDVYFRNNTIEFDDCNIHLNNNTIINGGGGNGKIEGTTIGSTIAAPGTFTNVSGTQLYISEDASINNMLEVSNNFLVKGSSQLGKLCYRSNIIVHEENINDISIAYAMRVQPTGRIRINSHSNKQIQFRHRDIDLMVINSNGDIDICKNLIVNHDATINDMLEVSNNLLVLGDASINNILEVSNNLLVKGSSNLGNLYYINNSITNISNIDISNSYGIKITPSGRVRINSCKNNQIQFRHEDNNLMILKANSEVEIVGTLTISGNTFPDNYGSAGQVLTTNGSGTLTWGDISGAGGGVGGGSTISGEGFKSNTTNTDVNSNGISIGESAGENNPGEHAIAIGTDAGNTSQSTESIAIGRASGYYSQYERSIAIGFEAGNKNQGTKGDEIDSDDEGQSIAIGMDSGKEDQRRFAIAIGSKSGKEQQKKNSISIGHEAGMIEQGENCIAIGLSAGVGLYDGEIDSGEQKQNSIAIGHESGKYKQGHEGQSDDGEEGNSISIGNHAGEKNQGRNSIAIGHKAGQEDQHVNTIVLNANKRDLNTSEPEAFYVRPIREWDDWDYVLTYDYDNTFEVSYMHKDEILSDDRYKSRTTDLEPGSLNIINQMSVKKYLLHPSFEVPIGVEDSDLSGVKTKESIGVIAQELEQIQGLERVVYTKTNNQTNKTKKRVNYNALNMYLLAGVQELHNMVVNDLSNNLFTANNRIMQLESENNNMKIALNELLTEAGKQTI